MEFNDKFGNISPLDKIYIHNSKALIPNLAVIKSRIIMKYVLKIYKLMKGTSTSEDEQDA